MVRPGREAAGGRDHDLREQHSEIPNDEWQRLFFDAFERGEKELIDSMLADNLQWHLESELLQSTLALGRMFGPRPPSCQHRSPGVGDSHGAHL